MRMIAANTLGTWSTALGPLTLEPGVAMLYLDPDSIDSASAHGNTVTVNDRWTLRQLIEQKVRRTSRADEPLLVRVCISDVRTIDDLPADYRHFPVRSLDVRLPPAALHDMGSLGPRHLEILAGSGSLVDRLSALA